jgi:hypothetical protein
MKNCIICGSETKHPSFDFCEGCFNMSIEEIEARHLEKRASATRKDQQEAPSREDSCKSPRLR